MNVADRMLARLQGAPTTRALFLLSSEGRDIVESWTRGRLDREIASWQTHFEAASLQPGDRVALALERDLAAVALHVACLASGLVVVPLNTSMTAPEVAAIVDASGARLVVAADAFAERMRDACSGDATWWSAKGAPTTARARAKPVLVEREDSDDALVIYTSGTTGQPKSVPLSHGNVRANLDALADVWQRTSSDRLLHVLPMHHYHGLVLALYGGLVLGSEVLIAPRFDARAALDAIRRHDINLLMGVPTMYRRMLDAATKEDDLAGVRLAISGSAPLGEATWRSFHERFGIALVERYGLTETGIVTSNPLDAPRAGSVGRPLSDTSIAIRDGERYVSPSPGTATARGEICIRGPSVMRGYGNDPDANARAFADGWFHSGDLGYFDADGYLWVDGRIKDLIIVGGSNVVPGEVERVLSGVESAAEICVAGVPDSDLGEIVVAYVVLRAAQHGGQQPHPSGSDDVRAAETAVERELRDAAERGLAPYKRPRRYVFVRELPRNAMGKIDRGKLTRA